MPFHPTLLPFSPLLPPLVLPLLDITTLSLYCAREHGYENPPRGRWRRSYSAVGGCLCELEDNFYPLPVIDLRGKVIISTSEGNEAKAGFSRSGSVG